MPPAPPNRLAQMTPLRLALFAVAAVALGLVEIGVLDYAYERIGVDPHVFGGLLLASFLGSMINLPLGEMHSATMPERRTILAVNVGGALVPTALSLYLVASHGLWRPGLLAVAFVAAVTHRLARPLPGVGIAVPVVLPPLVAAIAAVALAPAAAPALAYVAGTIGTLVGADLTNLGRIRDLGAPVASIGGAGTFDGVFLTGIIAVLLA